MGLEKRLVETDGRRGCCRIHRAPWLRVDRFENQPCQRGKGDLDGVGLVVARYGFAGQPQAIANVGATVIFRITVDQFAITSRAWDAHTVCCSNDRREIADDNHEFIRPFVSSHETEKTVFAVVAIQPRKTVCFEITEIQFRMRLVNVVQIGDQFLQSPVVFFFQ